MFRRNVDIPGGASAESRTATRPLALESLVLPNFEAFAWLVFLAELAVGLSLLTGTWTRLGALLGLAMSANLLVGLLDVPGEWPWSYAMMALLHGTILVTAAGRVWGIDARLRSGGRVSGWTSRVT